MSAPAWASRDLTTTVRTPQPAIATWAIAGILLAVWPLEQILIGMVDGGPPIGYLVFGALPNAMVAGRGGSGDWWQYMTTEFVHVTSRTCSTMAASITPRSCG
jgi:membrane associated rhomboid family serine protease